MSGPDAQKRRQYAAMLQSMATSFRMAEQMRTPVVFSFHPIDIAEMLEASSAIVRPMPRTTNTAKE